MFVITQTNFCVCVVKQTNFCLCVFVITVCVVTLQGLQIGETDSVSEANRYLSEANRYIGEARKRPAGARISGPVGPRNSSVNINVNVNVKPKSFKIA